MYQIAPQGLGYGDHGFLALESAVQKGEVGTIAIVCDHPGASQAASGLSMERPQGREQGFLCTRPSRAWSPYGFLHCWKNTTHDYLNTQPISSVASYLITPLCFTLIFYEKTEVFIGGTRDLGQTP